MSIDLRDEQGFQDRISAAMGAAKQTTPDSPRVLPPSQSPPPLTGPVPVIITSVDVAKKEMNFRMIRYASATPSPGELDVITRDLVGYPDATLDYEHYVGFVVPGNPPDLDAANNNSAVLYARQDARGAWIIMVRTLTLKFQSFEVDYLLCKTLATPEQSVKVRLPYKLRRTPFDGERIDGKDLVYDATDNAKRTSTNPSDPEDVEEQQITPSYLPGDIVTAQYEPAPTDPVIVDDVELHWVVNDNRAWAKVTPAPAAAGAAVAAGSTLPVDDSTAIVKGASDPTKKMRINVGAVTPGVTRVLSLPDNDVDLGDATAAKTGLATSVQIAKLDGIEALADVTDAANVAAAGAVMESLADAKGDVLAASAADTVTRLPVGADDEVLTADSAQATGLKWAAAGGGGAPGGADTQVQYNNAGAFGGMAGVTWDGTNLTLTGATKLLVRDSGIYLQSDVDGQCLLLADVLLKLGAAGDTEFGDGTERNVNPNTDLKINLGSATKRYNEAWMNEAHIQRSTANTSNPPTDAELDTAFGTPAALGNGFVAILDDGGAATNVYMVGTTGTTWWYSTMTKAV